MKTLTVSALVCAMIALTRATGSDQVNTGMCCSGWTEFNGRCFRYIPKPMTWASAEINCLSLGGNLASVHSVLEYHVIQRIIRSKSHASTTSWIGGSDAQEERKWFWSDGTSFGYVNWCRGEPNNLRHRQHCLLMNFRAGKCWDDEVCNAKRPSVCVKTD